MRHPNGIETGNETLPAAGEATSPSRRHLLQAGAAALALGAVRLRMPALAGAQDVASPATDICVMTPELDEGPFYLPLDLLRNDITERVPGLPLQLRIAVADLAGGCGPLANAAVDIWHCDAQGFYSGVVAEPGGGARDAAAAETGTFLRGIQMTDADGIAEFTTIYPGWYTGRAIHIHVKVHVGGTVEDLDLANPTDEGDYTGGHVSHTGQLFFEDAISDEVYDTFEAYGGRDNGERTRNDEDFILGDYADEPGFMMGLTPLAEGAPENGFLGTITIGVDPAATPDPVGFGGFGDGLGPPPGVWPPPAGSG